MVLQIRITENDGSNPVILSNTDNREYSKSLSSSDEGITFEVAKNDPKVDVITPYDQSSFTRFWEAWETDTNKRLNYNPR